MKQGAWLRETHTRTSRHTHTHSDTDPLTQAHTRTHTHSHTHTYTQTHRFADTHTHINKHSFINLLNPYMSAHIHTHNHCSNIYTFVKDVTHKRTQLQTYKEAHCQHAYVGRHIHNFSSDIVHFFINLISTVPSPRTWPLDVSCQTNICLLFLFVIFGSC